MIVIDGDNCVLGRIASFAAKQAMKGEDIHIVNCKDIVVTGTGKKEIMARYEHKVNLRNISNPSKSIKFSRRPDLMVRRTIKGMLPKTKPGAEAHKRIRVHLGIPKELEKSEKKQVGALSGNGVRTMTIMQISEGLGWKGA